MKRDYRVYLDDILEAIEKIQSYTSGVNEKTFYSNFQLQDAVLRRLEIIGEATKNLPINVRKKFPQTPWREMAGLRDVLIHEYFGVNIRRVWKIITETLPNLKKELNKIQNVYQV